MKAIAKLSLFTVMLTSIIFVLGTLAFAGGTPVPPESFYGTLTINSAGAPIGTQIKGMVSGIDKTVAGPYETEVTGMYGSKTFQYTKFFVDCQNDDVVTFSVEVSPGNFLNADQTAICSRGANTELNLTVNFTEACLDGEKRDCPLQDGVCAGAQETCIAGEWSGCDYGPDYQEQEIFCDGLDNDCDGAEDETLFQQCGVSDIGVCTFGTETCSAGSWINCDAVFPDVETCNGLDDDCDGQEDEDLGQITCGVGACEVTVDNCVGGVLQECIPGDPSPEVCDDGIDNDCDGLTDYGDPADCFEEFCINIIDVALLDANGNPVTAVTPGTMYQVQASNQNTCEDPVESMQIISISQGTTPKYIGTMKGTIAPGTTSVVTLGTVMPVDTPSGTGFTAKVFNWNHWISQGPDPHRALSESAEINFEAV